MSLDNTTSKTHTTHYNGAMTPAYPYTPTPTATLPYNTPDSTAQNAFQHLSKDNVKKQKHTINISNGFPYFGNDTESDQKQLIEIITESPSGSKERHEQSPHDIIPPQDESDDDTKEQHQQNNSSLNLDNLKINIPSDSIATNTHSKKRSKTFSLIEGDLNIKDIGSSEDITLNDHGYIKQTFIADTLQGSVYTVKNMKTNEIFVVKTGNKSLHSEGVTIQKK
eukprot:851953_1